MAYSKKIGIPAYKPKGLLISLGDTVDVDKFNQLVNEIEKNLSEGKISEVEAHYLRLAATRWIKFDYSKVAEYYCSEKCSPEMQKLLQHSAMVLLDVEDALAAGVVNCKSFVEELRQEEVENHPEDTTDSNAVEFDPYVNRKKKKEKDVPPSVVLDDLF